MARLRSISARRSLLHRQVPRWCPQSRDLCRRRHLRNASRRGLRSSSQGRQPQPRMSLRRLPERAGEACTLRATGRGYCKGGPLASSSAPAVGTTTDAATELGTPIGDGEASRDKLRADTARKGPDEATHQTGGDRAAARLQERFGLPEYLLRTCPSSLREGRRLNTKFRLGCHDLRSSSCRMHLVRNAQCPCCESRESETIQHTLFECSAFTKYLARSLNDYTSCTLSRVV